MALVQGLEGSRWVAPWVSEEQRKCRCTFRGGGHPAL